jgi:hypothetical protein
VWGEEGNIYFLVEIALTKKTINNSRVFGLNEVNVIINFISFLGIFLYQHIVLIIYRQIYTLINKHHTTILNTGGGAYHTQHNIA